MIQAEIYKQADGKMIGFSVKGHANTAPKGYDIYCAGVSALTQSAFICVRDYLKLDFNSDFADGKLMMKLKTPANDLTEAVFQTMLTGLREMEKIAPKIIKLKYTNF